MRRVSAGDGSSPAGVDSRRGAIVYRGVSVHPGARHERRERSPTRRQHHGRLPGQDPAVGVPRAAAPAPPYCDRLARPERAPVAARPAAPRRGAAPARDRGRRRGSATSSRSSPSASSRATGHARSPRRRALRRLRARRRTPRSSRRRANQVAMERRPPPGAPPRRRDSAARRSKASRPMLLGGAGARPRRSARTATRNCSRPVRTCAGQLVVVIGEVTGTAASEPYSCPWKSIGVAGAEQQQRGQRAQRAGRGELDQALVRSTSWPPDRGSRDR